MSTGVALGLFQRLPCGSEEPIKEKLNFKYMTLKRR